jgi:hypothetical protein
VTQDVGGLSELRWPSGSVIIQIDELSVACRVCAPTIKSKYSLQNTEVLLTICIFNTNAGGRKSLQPILSSD